MLHTGRRFLRTARFLHTGRRRSSNLGRCLASAARLRHRKPLQDDQEKDGQQRQNPACPAENRDMRGVDRLVGIRDNIEESTGGVERAMPDRRGPDTSCGQAQPSEQDAKDDAEYGYQKNADLRV